MSARSALVQCCARVGVVLVVCGVAACSRDPQAAAAKDVARADRYMANRQFSEAAIEYGRAVQARPDWAEAHVKRARAYLALGDAAKAYSALARAADLDVSNVDAPLQAGALALMAGDFESARTWAERVVRIDPRNAAAHTLVGQALTGLRQTDGALQQIEQALELDPSSVPAWTALGSARLRNGDRAKAREAFERAVTLAPSSVDAQLALAQYHWAVGDTRLAEETLTAALNIDPQHRIVHRALALLLVTTQRSEAAEPHFRALADRPEGAIALADYYLALHRDDAARKVLASLSQDKTPAYARAARLRLAAMDHAAGRTADGYRELDALIRERPDDAEAKLAKARWLIGDGDAAQAARIAADVVNAHQESAPAQYAAGLAALASGRLADAETAFRQVLAINPRAAAADIQLARVHLAQGNAGAALRASEHAAQLVPEDLTAGVLVARSLRAAGDLSRAGDELRTRLAKQPRSTALNVEMGWLALQRREPASARSAFATALRVDPRLYAAQAGLVAADIADGSVAHARALVDGWLRESPSNASLRVLLAKVQLAAHDTEAAERTLRDVATAEPSELEAYDLLGQLYLSQGQLGRALGEYQALSTRAPVDAGPLTMVAMIHEAQGDAAAARVHYEQALAKNPSAGVAANNLAWLYAEDGRLDEALTLATDAQSVLRHRPEAEDTLGWVHLKRGDSRAAISAFEGAIGQAPQKAVYHYHLGLAYAQSGQAAAAADAMRQALQLGLSGTDRTTAQARLDRFTNTGR